MAAEQRVFHTKKSSANYDIADIPRRLGMSKVAEGISDGCLHARSGVPNILYLLFLLNFNPYVNRIFFFFIFGTRTNRVSELGIEVLMIVCKYLQTNAGKEGGRAKRPWKA